nr:transposase [Endozoicomonas sp.]
MVSLKPSERAGEIHLSVDACGLPVAFEVTGGEVNDCTTAPVLLAKTPDAETVIGDKGYDSQGIRDQIVEQGLSLSISCRFISAHIAVKG